MFKKLTRLVPVLLTILLLAVSVASAQDATTLRIWHYEAADSAMGIAWDAAMVKFQEMHPEVTIEFELKTFEQIQQTGQMVLNSAEAPDVMEINKGNATAGLYASQGLLTDLTEVAAERGWDEILSPSVLTTSRYDANGIMGSGPLYGVTNYGEFVMVYYNKTMFEERGMAVPTSYEELTAIADQFVAEGIVPFALGDLDKWPLTHNYYELVLYGADRDFVNAYELYQGDIDFQNSPLASGAQLLVEQVEKGYLSPEALGMTYDDANAGFVQGTYPMDLTGSWAFGGFSTSITDFEWGIFLMPGKTLNTGSGGNLWVVPTGAVNKDLAYEFIDLTLSPEIQSILANAGGIPVNADLSQIADPKTLELNTAFSTLVANDGLAFYPDWPAPGYMDVLGAGLQDLFTGAVDVPTFIDAIAAPWLDYKSFLG
ncbi:MAG: extracellular solute-binding protein [Chloroflexi bacterium]|nr:extracellular solute-binding protein [Chloroflexota bacterium]